MLSCVFCEVLCVSVCGGFFSPKLLLSLVSIEVMLRVKTVEVKVPRITK